MRSIRPQTIGPAGNVVARAGLGKKIAIKGVVAGLRQQLLPAVAALRDAVRDIGNDDAGKTRHGATEQGSEVYTMSITSCNARDRLRLRVRVCCERVPRDHRAINHTV